jgi:hypothetical protein
MAWLISKKLMQDYENSPSSLGQAAEYLEENSLGGEPFVPLSGMPTQQAFLFPDKTTTAWKRFPSGMMCRPLTGNLGEDLLMWYREVFLAPTSPAPGREQALTETQAPCGNTWRESLAKYDPVTHSWRTRQSLLFEDSTECLEIFPRWGTMLNGELFPQQVWGLPISEIECGFLPFYPTPVASSHKSRDNAGGSGGRKWAKKNGTLVPYSQMHPNFYESLMGFPINWTDCDAVEMPKFQLWLQQHGEYLEENK